jgi:hypothetical protein
MNTTFDVLVIVLSCLLGIFLILAIITAVLILKLVSSLRSIVVKAEQLADDAGAIGETLRRNAAAFSVAKLFADFVGSVRGKKDKRS